MMRFVLSVLTAVVSVSIVSAQTLTDVCTVEYAATALPEDSIYDGITIDRASVTVSAVTNATSSGQVMFPDGSFDYCQVIFSYSHNGIVGDKVNLQLWLPTPAAFQNRWLSTGGGGLAINSGTGLTGSLPGGLIYGAAAGLTDGGFGSFTTQMDGKALLANGTVNWHTIYMFGYQAHHEMSVIGKAFTKNFFAMGDTKLYAYYQGCSEGGREGWSQIQRFADEWDGAVTGAPAFRFSHQQTQHLYSNAVEQTLGYYPPNCELAQIVNSTIAACDGLDGKVDGVVSRSDLCALKYNVTSAIGTPYYCAASKASTNPFHSTPATPAQNGTVSAEGALVAQTIIDGLHDSDGKRVYLSYQPAAQFVDAATAYDATTGNWTLSVSGLGAEWPARFLELQNTSTISTADFANVTYDTLKDWIYQGWQMYEDSLQTTWPDLTPFQKAGGKVIHYHGEADDSIPTASSVRYHESVRSVMYPDLSYNDSTTALNDWYRLFIIPGAAHCSPSTISPAPFPQTNLATLIEWVENGVEPVMLNATTLAGPNKGQTGKICAWPLRPYWRNNGTSFECQYDQSSIDTWHYDLNAFKMPVY